MVQAGGSATVYGVLYQMLRASHWATTIHLKATVDGDDLLGAQLILEPQGGGGDIQVVLPEKRIVEQLKAKSDEGTWSLKSLVSEVLPDLVRAVPQSPVGTSSVYRFVTEGREGRWASFNLLLHELRDTVAPPDPIAALDDSETLGFFPKSKQTRRGFLKEIVTELRAHPDLALDSEQVVASKLWQVFSAFQFQGSLSTSEVMRQLQAFLLHVVDRREDVPGKINELVGMTMRLAAEGNVSINSLDLLCKAGITSLPLGNWPALTERSREIIEHETRRTFRYQADLDVRETPEWPDEQPILILHGESGQGKTWRIAALARQLSSLGEMVVMISSKGNADADLTDASRIVWGRIANHDDHLSLERISARIRETCPKLQHPWLHLLIDNVSSVAEARQLAGFDWQRNGIRLAISTTPAIADSLKRAYPEICHLVQVTDFTTEQLQEYLERRGQEWGMITPDVRQTLRRPLLAQLYCEVANDQGAVPECEYDLYEQYWDRIRNAKQQADHHQDIGRVQRLARGTVTAESSYPWTVEDLEEAGIDDAGQVRLEQIGWLQRLDDGRVKVWHDRLLNWAVAESIVADFRSERISTDAMCDLFRGLSSQDASYRFLPYVPLDMLWRLASPGAEDSRAICTLMDLYRTRMRQHEDFAWNHGFPTLGERIIEPMISYLRQVEHQDWNPYPNWCAIALSEISERKPIAVEECALQLLKDTSPNLREAAIHLLALSPIAKSLDDLWVEHHRSCEILDQGQNAQCWVPYTRTAEALRACSALSPNWLVDQIDSLDKPDRMAAELAYLVANLRNETGAFIWQRTKRQLFKFVPQEKQRSLAACIAAFRDNDEIASLENWVTRDDDSIGSSSLAALSRMSPVTALLCVKQLNSWDRYLARAWWLPELVLRCPSETDQLVCELFAEQPDTFWGTANLFQGHEHLIGRQSLIAMLEKFSDDLALELADPPPEKRRSLYAPLGILSCIRSPELVSEIERRRGTPLEDQLVRIAIPWIGRHGNVFDREYHSARRLLWMIGGNGIREVVRAELMSTNKHARLDAIKLSPLVADKSIRTFLAEISRKEEFWDEQAFPFEQLQATVSLAELGDNQSVIESVLRWGDFFDTLLQVLRDRSMSDHEIEVALQVVKSGERSRFANGLRALGVTGRGDLAPSIYGQIPTDVDGKTLQAAVSAAIHLKDKSPDAFHLYCRGLDVPECRWQSVRGLQTLLPESLPILSKWLDKNGLTPGDLVGDIVAQILFAYPETQANASRHVLASLQKHGGHTLSTHLLRCLTDTDLEALKESLMDLAYAPETGLHIVCQRIAAIHALSRIDRDVAFRAAEIALARTTKDRDQLPSLLMALNEPKAIQLLAENVSTERTTAAIWATGRALRHAASQELVVNEIKQRFASTKWQDQLAACLMAGWLKVSHFHEELRSCATDSLDTRVSDAARQSIQRKSDERDVLIHFEQLRNASGVSTWSRLEAAIGIADPILLESEHDPLWIGHALHGHSPYLQILARDRIEKRTTELKEQADKSDRERK